MRPDTGVVTPKPAGSTWNQYDVTTANGLDQVKAVSQPFTDSANGGLSAFAIK